MMHRKFLLALLATIIQCIAAPIPGASLLGGASFSITPFGHLASGLVASASNIITDLVPDGATKGGICGAGSYTKKYNRSLNMKPDHHLPVDIWATPIQLYLTLKT